MNGLKTIINALLSKMNDCAKKSEVYKKSETYDKGTIDKKITKLDKSLSDVAKSGNYYDLNDIPEIPDVSDVLRCSSQTLTDAQKTQARSNIGAITASDCPKFEQVQVDLFQTNSDAVDYVKNNILTYEYGNNTFTSVSNGVSATIDGKIFKHVGNCDFSNLYNISIVLGTKDSHATVYGTYNFIEPYSYDSYGSPFYLVYLTPVFTRRTSNGAGMANVQIGITNSKEVILYCDYDNSGIFVSEVRKITAKVVKDEYISSEISRTEDIPKSALVPDAAGETPTSAEFNALLKALKDAGLMKTE